MYKLIVIGADNGPKLETVEVVGSQSVLETIPRLIAKHKGCGAIEVHFLHGWLFTVDCNGRPPG